MGVVDQQLAAKVLGQRLARTDNPRHRAMLETVIAHLRAEVAGSLEQLMDTLVPEPEYRLWAEGADYGPKGADAVRAYYGELVASKRGVLEFDIDRVVVDDDTVVTEGFIRAINRGTVARARGYDIDDDDADYLVSQRAVIFWPFDAEGRMVGEDGYANFDRTGARRLDPAELPDSYRALFQPVG